MRRFYLPPGALCGRTISLTGTDVRHMTTVLRLRPGSQVEFFDDQGAIHIATLETISQASLTAAVDKTITGKPVSPMPVTLIQSLLKGKKMDLVIQKITELGTERFIPVTSRYCEKRTDGERQDQRRHRIMLEACKQCRRSAPMQMLSAIPVTQVDFSSYRHKFLALETEQKQTFPPDLHVTPGPICLCIGPEGGWHPDEVEWFLQNGFTAVSLGNTILRAETAAISAVSILKYLASLDTPASDADVQ